MKTLLVPISLLAATAGWAQQPPPPEPSQPAPISQQQPTPQASEDQIPTEYGGPTLLSRGGSASVGRENRLLNLSPFVGVTGVYDSGLGTISVDQAGHAPTANSYGGELRFGVTGSRSWKDTDLDLHYTGALRHYAKQTYYDGFDNTLLFSVSHQATRRVTIQFDESAARLEHPLSMPNSMGIVYNSMAVGLGGNELFSIPTLTSLSSIRMIYQRTARLSFSAYGSGFVVRRRSSVLVGATGYASGGDIAYRLSRTQTIGLDYSFNHFDFTHSFGYANMHSVAGNYAVRLGKRWEFTLRGGGYRVEAQRLIQVQLDPAIAAIFGQSTGVELFHRIVYLPLAEAHLTWSARYSTWSAGYSRSMMPGNGVYLTSSSDQGTMAYTYSGIHSVGLQASAGYSKLSSVSQTIGRYSSYTGGLGANVKLSHTLSLIARVDGRHYQAGGSSLQRNYYRAALGLAWNPGERPVSIW